MAHDATDDPLEGFRWHPEPELIGIRDAATSRRSLELAGKATWDALGDDRAGEPLGAVLLKGKSAPVEAWRLHDAT